MRLEGRGLEKVFDALAFSWIVVLHLRCFYSAGPMWRDESNSVLQASLPTWGKIWASLEFDSFPILYPSVLRLWSELPLGHGDSSLRLLGLGTGLVLLVSLRVVGRWASGHLPLFCLALVAADPVLISEGDSIRPYGVGLLCMLWAFGFIMRCVSCPSWPLLCGAVLASVLAVQTSYVNALFIGVFCTCAMVIGLRHEARCSIWKYLLPGAAAAASLLPYAKTLRNSRIWASMLHSRIDWRAFLRGYFEDHSMVYTAVWLGSVVFVVFAITKGRRGLRLPAIPGSAATAYAIMAGSASAVVMMLFLQVTGIPPFPRYFLPGAILLALALESLLTHSYTRVRVILAAAAILAGAAPTWNWLGQRHTNMDLIAASLERSARPGDIIVISPWFLHPSFQLYYGGSVDWCTVPDLARYPMMRYDLVRDEIIHDGSSGKLTHRLARTLDGGGAIWFIAQKGWVQLDRREAPEPPQPVAAPEGRDYVSFRSYWERDIEFRLRACCLGMEEPVPRHDRVWAEEDLVLTRWTPAAKWCTLRARNTAP